MTHDTRAADWLGHSGAVVSVGESLSLEAAVGDH